MKNEPLLYIVVPCYNEEEMLPISAERLLGKLTALQADHKISGDSRILFVDDGSKDKTWSIIADLHRANPSYQGIKLSRNFGQQGAIVAGLSTAVERADVIISIDVDLQDDINAMNQMLDEYQKGTEIVFGVRSSRKKDTFLKRFTAQSFYKLMNKMGAKTIYNHSEFRLMTQAAVRTLLQYQETNLFLRGIVAQLGFPTAIVTYEREKRTAGKTKYSVRKMLGLALDGITSFSDRLLRMAWSTGFLFLFLGLIGFATTLTLMYTMGISMLWPILTAMVALTGVVLLALGVIGLYLGKMYLETKHRPRFIVEKDLTVNDANTAK